jgi:acetyl esterase/lipase
MHVASSHRQSYALSRQGLASKLYEVRRPESGQMLTAVKAKGLDVQYVLYPGAHHGGPVLQCCDSAASVLRHHTGRAAYSALDRQGLASS